MKYPDFIKENGSIGFVAPAFGCTREPHKTAFKHALNIFHKMSYKTVLGPNCFEVSGIGKSNTPQKCGEEINEMYCSSETDILISCAGGELMCEDLEFIDFERLAAAKPKWFVGFSDNTNLTFTLATLCDTASIYGANAPAYGMEPWHESVQDTFSILQGKNFTIKGYDGWERESLRTEENPYAPFHLTEPKILRSYPTENAYFTGRLLGGCMDCLTNLTGTKYDKVKEFCERYKEDGIIWFMEACDLNTMSIRRALWQMEQSGWFQYVKGFLIGRPLQFEDETLGLNHYDAVTGILGKYQVPIIMDIDLGHWSPTMPLICGSVAEVSVQGNDLTVDMKLL